MVPNLIKSGGMPAVFRSGPYRFFFYSDEGTEPIHIHVSAQGKEARYWIEPVRLAFNDGFARHELIEIRDLIEQNVVLITEKWNEHFEIP